MNNIDLVLQARIDEYAFGVWFDTTDVNPYENTVTIQDPISGKEVTFSDEEGKIKYRTVEATE